LGMTPSGNTVSNKQHAVENQPRFSEPQVLVAPIVFDTRISGFLFSSIVLEMDAKAKADLSLPVEMILQDRYLAFVVGNPEFLFPRSPRFDVLKFKEGLKSLVNSTVGAQLVNSVYVSDVNFLATDEARRKQTLRSVWLQERTKRNEPASKSKPKESH